MSKAAAFVCTCGRKPKVQTTLHSTDGVTRRYPCLCGHVIITLERISTIRHNKRHPRKETAYEAR